MDFSTDGMVISLVTGVLGIALFRYGKKQERMLQLVGGIALMVYPYFVSGLTATVGVGLAIIAGIVLAVCAGL